LVYLRAPSLSTLNAWTDPNALFLGMRTGYIAGGHCQLEMGSFTFDAMGVRWAYDLGAENYSCNGMGNLTPNNDIDYADGLQNRWQYYRNQARGNNTLVMVSTTGSPQVYMPDQSLNSAVPVIAFDANPLTPMAVVDMTSAYTAVPNVLPGSTSVTKALRGTRFISDPGFPQAMQIQDEITNSAQAVNVIWTMHTQVPLASIALSSGGTTATLISGNSGLVMTIVSPVGATFATPAVTPTETAPAGQASNAGVNTLSTTIQVPANAAKTLTINMCPYSTGGAIPTGLTLPTAALSTWK